MQELEGPVEVPQSAALLPAVVCRSLSLIMDVSQYSTSFAFSSPALLALWPSILFSLAGNSDLTEGGVQKSESVWWPTPFLGMESATLLSFQVLQESSLSCPGGGSRPPDLMTKGKVGGQSQWCNPKVHWQN